ncbi:hypothetical protein ACVW1A_006432 [Bradyrhizobium sp. LB1.3]
MSAALGLKAKPIATEPADDDSDISALINRLTAEVNQIAVDKTKAIQQITNQMKMLALNALIESSRAGAQGGFKRSSQHQLLSLITEDRQAPPPAFSSLVSSAVGH